MGPAGEALDALPGIADVDGWRSDYWYARAATIYAGTSEIQRGIIATRVLGLPRSADADPRPATALPVDGRFSEEQLALRDVARDLFAKIAPVARLRELYDGAPIDRDGWQQVAEVGITGIGVPEPLGGMGGDATDLVLVLEEGGRAVLPEPLATTMGVAVRTLVASGHDAADDVLRAIAAGEATVGTWFADEPYLADPGHDWVLCERSDALVLVATDDLAEGTPVPAEDGTRRLVRTRVPDDVGTRLGDAHLVATARRHAAAASAAELVGTCTHLFEATLDDAKVRRQFAAPIGSFQAVAHELASMFVVLESARGAAHHAARRLAAGADDADRAAHVAKAAANEASRRIETSALQLHGGIGFTWEHDLHLWLKHALALQVLHGDTRTHRRALASTLLDRRKDPST